MNTTTRLARILAGYVTIGIVFGVALSGGPCVKSSASQPNASPTISSPVACEQQQKTITLLSYVSYAARSQSLLAD